MNAVDFNARRKCSASRGVRLVALAMVLLTLGSVSALADAGSNEFERGTKDIFSVSLGTFLMNFNTKARLDSIELGRGTEIDGENDLGLPKGQTRIRLDGYWRFARKHRLEFAGYFFRKDRNRTANQEIQWGDNVYALSAGLHSESSMDVFKISYKWSLVRNDKWDAGVSAGISGMYAKLKLAGDVTVDGTLGGFESESKSALAPIPLIGFHAEWKFARQWYLKASGEYFKIGVEDKEGSAKDFRLAVNWYPFKHWGFGGGVNAVTLKYEDNSEPAYKFEYGYDGFLFYATYVY